VFCDDWDCPAAVSCGHAFGRSEAYASMRMPSPPAQKFGREEGAEACARYFTDKPRSWIHGVEGLAETGEQPKVATR